MASAVKVTVKDHGAKRAQALLKQQRHRLRVGILETEASQPHPSRPGTTVGQVAAWMEYGTEEYGHTTPRRSWLFDWKDENIDVIVKQLAAATMRVIFANEDEKWALSKLGTIYRRQIEERIRYANVFASNAPSTIKKKGFDLPLIDTETFIEAIRWEVVK